MRANFQPQNREARADGYERRDVNAAWIFGIVGLLAFTGFLMHLVLLGVQERLAKKPAPTDRWAGLRVSRDSDRSKPYPRLQISPAEELKAFRQREELWLNSYGWVNRTAGIAHIPIDRAMDLLAKRGLPQQGDGTNKVGPSPYELQLHKAQNAGDAR